VCLKWKLIAAECNDAIAVVVADDDCDDGDDGEDDDVDGCVGADVENEVGGCGYVGGGDGQHADVAALMASPSCCPCDHDDDCHVG
jgi:hypothetical protein